MANLIKRRDLNACFYLCDVIAVNFEITTAIKLIGILSYTQHPNNINVSYETKIVDISCISREEMRILLSEILSKTIIGYNILGYGVYILEAMYKYAHLGEELHLKQLSDDLLHGSSKYTHRPLSDNLIIDTCCLYKIFLHGKSGNASDSLRHSSIRSYMGAKGLCIEVIDYEIFNTTEVLDQDTLKLLEKNLLKILIGIHHLFNESFIQERLKVMLSLNPEYIHLSNHEVAKYEVKQWGNSLFNNNNKLISDKLMNLIKDDEQLIKFVNGISIDENYRQVYVLDNVSINLGMGGAHGIRNKIETIIPSDKKTYINVDFNSFYPTIYTQCDIFNKVVENRLKEKLSLRLSLKQSKDLVDIAKDAFYKIELNSIFGLLEYIDRKSLKKVTVIGQILICCLVKEFINNSITVNIVNTDGIDLETVKGSEFKVDIAINEFRERLMLLANLNFGYTVRHFSKAYYENVNSIVYMVKEGHIDWHKSTKDFRLSTQCFKRYGFPIASVKHLINTVFSLNHRRELKPHLIDYFLVASSTSGLGFVLVDSETKEEEFINNETVRYYYGKKKTKLYLIKSNGVRFAISSSFFISVYNGDMDKFDEDLIDKSQYTKRARERLSKNRFGKDLNELLHNQSLAFAAKGIYTVPSYYKHKTQDFSSSIPNFTNDVVSHVNSLEKLNLFDNTKVKSINSLSIMSYKHIILDIDNIDLISYKLIDYLTKDTMVVSSSDNPRSIKVIFSIPYRYTTKLSDLKKALFYNKGIEYFVTKNNKVNVCAIWGKKSSTSYYTSNDKEPIPASDELLRMLNLNITPVKEYKSTQKSIAVSEISTCPKRILEALHELGFNFVTRGDNLWVSHCIEKEPENKTKVRLQYNTDRNEWILYCMHAKCSETYSMLQNELNLGFQPISQAVSTTFMNLQLDSGANLIMAPTGSGKTTYMINNIIKYARFNNKYLIVSHSHKRSEELRKKFALSDVKVAIFNPSTSEEKMYCYINNLFRNKNVIICLYHYLCCRGLDSEKYFLGRCIEKGIVDQIKESLGFKLNVYVDEAHIPIKQMRRVLTIDRPMLKNNNIYLEDGKKLTKANIEFFEVERNTVFLEEGKDLNMENRYKAQYGCKHVLEYPYPQVDINNCSYYEKTFLVKDIKDLVLNRTIEPTNFINKIQSGLEKNALMCILTRHVPYLEIVNKDNSKTIKHLEVNEFIEERKNRLNNPGHEYSKLVIPVKPYLQEAIFESDIGIMALIKLSDCSVFLTATLTSREVELLSILVAKTDKKFYKYQIEVKPRLETLIADYYKSDILSHVDFESVYVKNKLFAIEQMLDSHNKQALFFLETKDKAKEKYDELKAQLNTSLLLCDERTELVREREINAISRLFVSHLDGIFAVGTNLPNISLLTVSARAFLPRSATAMPTLIDSLINRLGTLQKSIIQALGRNARLSCKDDKYTVKCIALYNCSDNFEKLITFKLQKSLYNIYQTVIEEHISHTVTFSAYLQRVQDCIESAVNVKHSVKPFKESMMEFIIDSWICSKAKPITKSNISTHYPNIYPTLTVEDSAYIISKVKEALRIEETE